MMQKAWSSIEEVSYCFSRSSVKFQGHMAQRIFDFDSTWAFPDCNSSLNSLMDLKWCTKLDVEEKTCPIIFRGHPSNSNVTYARLIPYRFKNVLFYLGFCYQAHRLIGILGNTVFIMRRGPVGPLHYTGDSQSSWNIHHHRGERNGVPVGSATSPWWSTALCLSHLSPGQDIHRHWVIWWCRGLTTCLLCVGAFFFFFLEISF